MSRSLIDVNYIARLAHLRLTEEETERYSCDISQVLEYMDILNRYDTSGVEAMSHPLPTCDAVRADEPRPGLSVAEALRNAPEQSQDQVRVPKVVESA